MTDEQKLVEEMVQKHLSYDAHNTAIDMLSVVKRNIGVVAKSCPCCKGLGVYDYEGDTCYECHGTGVVAKGE